MNDLQKLYTKSKDYTKKLGNGEKLSVTIKQLSLDNLKLLKLDEELSMEENTKNTIELVSISLGIGEEEVLKISVEHLEWLTECIMDANDMKEKENSKKRPLTRIEKLKLEAKKNK